MIFLLLACFFPKQLPSCISNRNHNFLKYLLPICIFVVLLFSPFFFYSFAKQTSSSQGNRRIGKSDDAAVAHDHLLFVCCILTRARSLSPLCSTLPTSLHYLLWMTSFCALCHANSQLISFAEITLLAAVEDGVVSKMQKRFENSKIKLSSAFTAGYQLAISLALSLSFLHGEGEKTLDYNMCVKSQKEISAMRCH